MIASRLLVSALVVVVVAGGVAEAAQSRKVLPPSADHPGKCYDPDLNLVLAPGDKQPAEGTCQEYSCSRSDSDFLLVTSTCGSVGVGNGCVLDTPNPDSPYPQCCPVPKC